MSRSYYSLSANSPKTSKLGQGQVSTNVPAVPDGRPLITKYKVLKNSSFETTSNFIATRRLLGTDVLADVFQRLRIYSYMQ